MLYRNRFYSQDLGRFLHRDPIGVINLYWSVRNSPLSRTDASGLIDHLVTVKLPPDWTNCEVNCAEPNPSKGHKTAQPCKEADLKPSEDTACQTALAAALNDQEVKDLLNRISKIRGCNHPNMECKCCGGNCRAGAWHMGDSIYICDGQGHAVIRHLKHELTHHIQSCEKWPDTSCEDRMKKEVTANLAGGIDFNEAFKKAVWSSCIMKRCTVSQITDTLMQKIWNEIHPSTTLE